MSDPQHTEGRTELALRRAIRIAGLVAFVLCGVLIAAGQEFPVAFLLVAAGCMGLDSIQGYELRRKQGGE